VKLAFPEAKPANDAKKTKRMSVNVFLSGHLKGFTGGQTEFRLNSDADTVGDALASLWLERSALRDRILNEQGEIRQHVNIFYEGRDVRRLSGLETPIDPDAELHIFNAVSGG
jgi:sulfur-carrier protein